MRHCALPIFRHIFITLAASSRKRTVTVSRPSVCLFVCPVGILTVTHQGTACDAASVHFGPTACLHKLSSPKTTAWVMLRPTDKYFHRMVMLLRVAITLFCVYTNLCGGPRLTLTWDTAVFCFWFIFVIYSVATACSIDYAGYPCCGGRCVLSYRIATCCVIGRNCRGSPRYNCPCRGVTVFTCICLSVLFARYVKNRCHQTGHRNVPRWVLATHLFWDQKVKV